ncbi:hypothetical protein GUJ93_ZPchr0004g40321 [Zizania palustris]|uniref:Flavodoxin-like domain-containing protein n=1 Tax=Zizania palustris TaxID=103762 RepID=A0A8J5VZ57_ZIZPA|nr:hypothetical protein GUJ93_ZPchr0004g40321 [Zizania palustris]
MPAIAVTLIMFGGCRYGDVEPTDTARFYKWFTEHGKEREVWLKDLKYAVFGLGNRLHDHFNKVTKVVDGLAVHIIVSLNI